MAGCPATPTYCLGGAIGAGFSWTDQTVYKLGVAYKNALPSLFGEKLTLRAGYNYGKMPINKDYLLFSLLAPATTEEHITLGMTYSLGEQSIFGFGSEGALTLAYMHAVKKKIEGNTIGVGGGPGIASMEMFQNSLDIAYTLKF
jgi:long-chain fatty acid transport protein